MSKYVYMALTLVLVVLVGYGVAGGLGYVVAAEGSCGEASDVGTALRTTGADDTGIIEGSGIPTGSEWSATFGDREAANPDEVYDVTETDIFSYSGYTGEQISVMGVKVGDHSGALVELIGLPDTVIEEQETINYYYGPSLKVSDDPLYPALIFQMSNEDEIVEKIFVGKLFNSYLHGSTKIDYDLRGIYDQFGIPPKQEDISRMRAFTYPEQGLEVYHHKKKMVAFALMSSE